MGIVSWMQTYRAAEVQVSAGDQIDLCAIGVVKSLVAAVLVLASCSPPPQPNEADQASSDQQEETAQVDTVRQDQATDEQEEAVQAGADSQEVAQTNEDCQKQALRDSNAVIAGFQEIAPIRSRFDCPPEGKFGERHSATADKREVFWSYWTDPPSTPNSHTGRCERSVDEFWGGKRPNPYKIYQFEGDLYVDSRVTRLAPKPSSEGRPDYYNYGFTVMQVFGGAGGPTTAFMLSVVDDADRPFNRPPTVRLVDGGTELMTHSITNRWIRVNVIHDAKTHCIEVFLDSNGNGTNVVYGRKDHGAPSSSRGKGYYFKYGVYRTGPSSDTTQSVWRNVRFYKKK